MRNSGSHKQLAAAKTPHEQTVLNAQIAAADRHIDRLVYELYGLTDDEIKIVEEGTGNKSWRTPDPFLTSPPAPLRRPNDPCETAERSSAWRTPRFAASPCRSGR